MAKCSSTTINTWDGKIVNNWMKDYFYPSYSTIYVFICFTFRGIIALSYWDLHSLFLSVMCPPYENWFNYWLSCPQLVKSVNGSIPILMSKRDQFSLRGFRKTTPVWHEHYFSHRVTAPHQQYQALSFWLWKALSLLALLQICSLYNLTMVCQLRSMIHALLVWTVFKGAETT